MLTDHDLQKAFRLIYRLHPDRAVAQCVLQDAYDRISLIRKAQGRRPGSLQPFKPKIREDHLLQLAVYLASEGWEKDQESEKPRMEPKYQPTRDDLLVRYIKTVILKAMVRRSCYTAVGIGCLLYTYQPHEISSLSEEHFNSDNIRRVKRRMIDELKNRFRRMRGFQNGNGHVELEIPSERQVTLIQKSLSGLAPWLPCDAAGHSSHSLLETFFNKESKKSEWERSHVLADPACGGMPRLVNEYNATYGEGSAMRLDDPESKLRSPKFDDDLRSPSDNDQEGGPSDPGGRFNPPPLTHNEISSIKHSFERNQKRRKNYQHSALRVFVDGEEAASFTQSDSLTPFAISNMASSVEVFGEDADGELLLAAFPLFYLESADGSGEQKFHVAHEGGQNISLTVSPASEHGDATGESLAWIEYSEPRQHNTEINRFNSDDQPLVATSIEEAPPINVSGIEQISSGVVYQTTMEEAEFSFETLLSEVLAGRKPVEDLVTHHGFLKRGKQHCAGIMGRYAKTMRLYYGVSYETEDLFNEVCMKIIDIWHRREARGKRPDGRDFPNESAFSGWVFSVARNLVLNKLRKSKQRQEDGVTPVHEPLDNFDLADNALHLERGIILREFLEFTETLSEKQQRVMKLWCAGYSYKEITQTLNDDGIECSHGTIRRWIKSSLEAFLKSSKRGKDGDADLLRA